jgi:hypothetical protein
MHGSEEVFMHGFVGKPKGKILIGRPNVGGRFILRRILEK